VQWTRTFGGGGSDEGQYVQQTGEGGYIVVGSTTSFSSGGSDVWFIRLRANGDVVWTRTLGGTEWDWGSVIKQVGDDGFIMAGCCFTRATLPEPSASLSKTRLDSHVFLKGLETWA